MGAAANHEGILDLVYETSVDPSAWPRLLERFSRAMGGHSAALRSYHGATEVGTVTASRLDAQLLDRQFREHAARNPLKSTMEVFEHRQRSAANFDWTPGMMRDVQWLPKSEFVRTEYYCDVYRPLDIHSDISIGFAFDGVYWSGVDVYRSQSQGAFTEVELDFCAALHPHMVRAWKLGQKLSRARRLNDSLADFAEQSPHGLFILDRAGLVRHANAAGQSMLTRAQGLRAVGGQLSGLTQAATRGLRGLIKTAAIASGARAGGSIALPQPDGLRPLSVIVAPLRAEQVSPLLDGPAVMICVTDLDADVTLPEQRLRDLFSLTPAETRVAISLFEGFEPRLAAQQLGISVWTVRRHLAQIFEKTRTNSQAELARLMMRTLGAALG